MGNLLAVNVAPTSDDRIQRAMQTFGLTANDIVPFWKVWKRCDVSRQGMISTCTFYDKVVHEPRTLFGDALFDIIECVDPDTIDFGEFVAAICTYCFFEIPEILKFCFFVFDREKNGFVPQSEFRLLIDALHNHNMNANVIFALDNLKYKKHGKFYFREFVEMHKRFPSILFPAFQLQNAMMTAGGGERWWSTRKNRLLYHRENADNKQRKIQRRLKREAEAYRQAQIRRHMGTFAYVFFPWERKRFDAIYPTEEDAADAKPSATEAFDDDDERPVRIVGRTDVTSPSWASTHS